MPRILNPKDVNGTTRFLFDFKLNQSMISQLFNEFNESDTQISRSFSGVKLINKEKMKSIEITKEFISFFPPLDDSLKEQFRKRIYQHVAKRSEVYSSTSKENFELSISSLLSDDLRSCASLLYYSLHKFISGEMYRFFNDRLSLHDHKVYIREVEHFTSSNFYEFTKIHNTEIVPINSENYLNLLCVRKDRRVDPFLLCRHVLNDRIENTDTALFAFIEYISESLLNINYRSDEIVALLDQELNLFYKKKKSKNKISQEDEAQAAITYAIRESFKPNNEQKLWLLYALFIRLYWLRQTADYEFDFDVKTSLREISIILSVIDSLLSYHQGIDENLIQINSKHVSDVVKEENKNEENSRSRTYSDIDIKFYKVENKFPQEINFKENVFVYITAIHLDYNFNKDTIISVLNLTENVTNKSKYFIYENILTIPLPLYLHINDDGRWTIWFAKNHFEIVSDKDIINCFLNFMEVLSASHKSLGIEFSPKIVASNPVFLEPSFESLNIMGISVISNEFVLRKKVMEARIATELGFRLKCPLYKLNRIKIGDQEVVVNIIFDINDVFDIIPIREMFYNNGEDTRLAVFTLYLSDTIKDPEEFEEAIYGTYEYLIAKHNFKNNIDLFEINSVTASSINKFILEEDANSDILRYFISFLNQLSYQRIEQGVFVGTDIILKSCLSSHLVGAYPYATMGYWYFNNPDLSIEESEEKGIEFYNKAIEMDAVNKEEYIIRLQHKYHLETARFLKNRKRDIEQASKYIVSGLAIGNEETDYYMELIDLEKEIGSLVLVDSTQGV